MSRVQVARAVFAIASSGALLAIALVGAGLFQDPSRPTTLPPWAIEPARGRDGAPLIQPPSRPLAVADQFAAAARPIAVLWPATSTSFGSWPQPKPDLAAPPPLPLTQAGDR